MKNKLTKIFPNNLQFMILRNKSKMTLSIIEVSQAFQKLKRSTLYPKGPIIWPLILLVMKETIIDKTMNMNKILNNPSLTITQMWLMGSQRRKTSNSLKNSIFLNTKVYQITVIWLKTSQSPATMNTKNNSKNKLERITVSNSTTIVQCKQSKRPISSNRKTKAKLWRKNT